MEKMTLDKDGNPVEPRTRRAWMGLAAGLGAALALGACGKNHRNRDDDEEDAP